VPVARSGQDFSLESDRWGLGSVWYSSPSLPYVDALSGKLKVSQVSQRPKNIASSGFLGATFFLASNPCQIERG